MKTLDQHGHFKVVEVERIKTGCAKGLRVGWTEYQVREGRRVLARYETLISAIRDAQKRNNDLWDDIGRQLKKGSAELAL